MEPWGLGDGLSLIICASMTTRVPLLSDTCIRPAIQQDQSWSICLAIGQGMMPALCHQCPAGSMQDLLHLCRKCRVCSGNEPVQGARLQPRQMCCVPGYVTTVPSMLQLVSLHSPPVWKLAAAALAVSGILFIGLYLSQLERRYSIIHYKPQAFAVSACRQRIAELVSITISHVHVSSLGLTRAYAVAPASSQKHY